MNNDDILFNTISDNIEIKISNCTLVYNKTGKLQYVKNGISNDESFNLLLLKNSKDKHFMFMPDNDLLCEDKFVYIMDLSIFVPKFIFYN